MADSDLLPRAMNLAGVVCIANLKEVEKNDKKGLQACGGPCSKEEVGVAVKNANCKDAGKLLDLILDASCTAAVERLPVSMLYSTKMLL
jgi:hypothetical protein